MSGGDQQEDPEAQGSSELAPPSPASPEQSPEPITKKKRRRSPKKTSMWSKNAGLILVFVAVVFGMFGFVFDQASERFRRGGVQTDSATIVEIEKGQGLRQISDQLFAAGLFDDNLFNRQVFFWGTRLTGRAAQLKAGEYAFPIGVSMDAAVEIMVGGKVVHHKFTLPPGTTSFQAVELLKAVPNMSGDVGAVPDEGSLLPETYLYVKHDERSGLIERMKAAMIAKSTKIWEKRADHKMIKSVEEMIILASIIEKETGVKAERGLVAGVFHNRMRMGMMLQSDPTVIYAVAGGEGLKRKLTKKDLALKSPFNTYQVRGLPPKPIANPSRAAMRAAVNPAQTDALFFVADGTGGHAFAKTLAEHNRNVLRWRQIEKRQ